MAQGLNIAGFMKGSGSRDPVRPARDDNDDPILAEILHSAAKADRGEGVRPVEGWTEESLARALRGE